MRRRLIPILALGAIAALTTLPGCYENVVAAKGMGAQGVSVSQPNGPEGSRTQTTTQKRSLRLDRATPR